MSWRTELFAEGEWVAVDPPASVTFMGASRGFFVRERGTDQLAFLKPTLDLPDHTPWPAYEKICADLAFDLGLPVPPVLLYERLDGPAGIERRTCLSLVLDENFFDWPEHWAPDAAQKKQALEALGPASGIVAFDVWVQNSDRDNFRPNTVFYGDPWRAFFLDWGNCLNRQDRWMSGGFSVSVGKVPDLLREAIEGDRILACLEAIEGLEPDELRKTVRRIPDDYLSSERRDRIAAVLLDRRESLRAALEDLAL